MSIKQEKEQSPLNGVISTTNEILAKSYDPNIKDTMMYSANDMLISKDDESRDEPDFNITPDESSITNDLMHIKDSDIDMEAAERINNVTNTELDPNGLNIETKDKEVVSVSNNSDNTSKYKPNSMDIKGDETNVTNINGVTDNGIHMCSYGICEHCPDTTCQVRTPNFANSDAECLSEPPEATQSKTVITIPSSTLAKSILKDGNEDKDEYGSSNVNDNSIVSKGGATLNVCNIRDGQPSNTSINSEGDDGNDNYVKKVPK